MDECKPLPALEEWPRKARTVGPYNDKNTFTHLAQQQRPPLCFFHLNFSVFEEFSWSLKQSGITQAVSGTHGLNLSSWLNLRIFEVRVPRMP